MKRLGSIRYEIVVPTTYNDGLRIPENIIEAYRKELLDVFGGITQYGSVTGYWTPPPDWKWEQKGESNLVLTIDAQREANLLYMAIFKDILKRLRVQLDQQSIHFTSFVCDSFLVENSDEERIAKLAAVEVSPTDRLFVFDKTGRIIAHGNRTQIENITLEDGDLILLVNGKYVEKYLIDQLQTVGR